MLRRVAAYGSWKAGWHLRQRRHSSIDNDNDNSPWVVSNESSTVTALEEGFRVLHHHHRRRVIMERSRRWTRTTLLPIRPLLPVVMIVRLFLRLSQLHPKVSCRLLLGSLTHGVPCNHLGRRQQPQRQLRHHNLPRLLLPLYRLCRHPNRSSSYEIGSNKIM